MAVLPRKVALADVSRLRLLYVLALLVVIVIITTLLGGASYYAWPSSSPSALLLDQDTFVSKWLNVSIGNPSDGYALDQLCHHRNVTWYPNLIVNVEDANGGIGNIRGNILDFLFFAISTGSSILLPTFAARSKTDLSSLFAGRAPFTSFFDEAHFVSTVRRHCPELHIYSSTNIPALRTVADRYTPTSMRTDLDPSASPARSAQAFHTWLTTTQSVTLPPQSPTLVNLGRTLWDGPNTFSQPAKLRHDYGTLLRHAPGPRHLAAVAVHNLARRHRIPLNPSAPYHPHAYMGAHLRTEPDARKAGWLATPTDPAGAGAAGAGANQHNHANFSAQTDAYLSQAVRAGLKVIYCATGDGHELARFRRKAWDLARVNVTGKEELLDGAAEREALERLTWDQKAVVDWEVLARSSEFGGFVRSSFAYNVAVSRAVVLELQGRNREERWWEVGPERVLERDGIAWRDPLSTVWGRDEWHEKKIPRGAWP